jgi:indolepyruvate ferredoxin oxidoreductase
VARNYFKLLAYKDEYEVARLFADPAFRAGLDARFEGGYTLRFHLAPTFLARPDPDSGRIRKIVFGPWMETAFGWLARPPPPRHALRPLRLPPRAQGRTGADRPVRGRHRRPPAGLDADSLPRAIALARLPEDIRGFGHVKAWSMKKAAEKRAALLAPAKPGHQGGAQVA